MSKQQVTRSQGSSRGLQIASLIVGISAAVAGWLRLDHAWYPPEEPSWGKGVVMELHLEEGDSSRKVHEDSVFETGDCLRVELTAPATGHLYLLGRGYDGRTDLLYPNPASRSRVVAGNRVLLPEHGICFAGEANLDILTERLVVVFGQKPVGFLEDLAEESQFPEVENNWRLRELLNGTTENDPVLIRRFELKHAVS